MGRRPPGAPLVDLASDRMGGLLTSDLARLGALPALRLGVGFALPVGAARSPWSCIARAADYRR